MREPTWVGSPIDIRVGQAALDAMGNQNDAKYWDPEKSGTLEVDRARWEEAQRFEEACWCYHGPDCTSDRHHEHEAIFDKYQMLPKDLGDVLEVGCGPFTQLRTILTYKTAKSITLQDPLIEQYRTRMRYCSYKDGTLLKVPVKPVTCMLEGIFMEISPGAFDTVVCINVLEHVMNAGVCLENIFSALKPGGLLVMGERPIFEEFDPLKCYDIGHPIKIMRDAYDAFFARFEQIFRSTQHAGYFVGRKPCPASA